MPARQFEKDIYISYSHLDDLPLVTGEQGWVTKFHKALSNLLSVRLGRRASIWRDEKLLGNDSFATEMVAQFPKTAILISVLSPCYVESEWCRKEVATFCEAVSKVESLKLENISNFLLCLMWFFTLLFRSAIIIFLSTPHVCICLHVCV